MRTPLVVKRGAAGSMDAGSPDPLPRGSAHVVKPPVAQRGLSLRSSSSKGLPSLEETEHRDAAHTESVSLEEKENSSNINGNGAANGAVKNPKNLRNTSTTRRSQHTSLPPAPDDGEGTSSEDSEEEDRRQRLLKSSKRTGPGYGRGGVAETGRLQRAGWV